MVARAALYALQLEVERNEKHHDVPGESQQNGGSCLFLYLTVT